MKRILQISFAALALLFTSCQKPFDKSYDLAVDALSYTLPAVGDSFPLYVYCSGEWSAAFEEPVSWISVREGTGSGKGNGLVRIEYKDNDVALRETDLTLRSGQHVITVHLQQKYDSTRLEVL